MDVNYFDGQHEATNTINHQQIVDSAEPWKDDIPELVDNDTGKKSENNMEQYIRYNEELETIPEESDEDLPVTVQATAMKETPYCTSKGTRKMSSLIQPLMTPPMTQ